MLVSLKVYQKSKVGQALMYMQHGHMACGEFHICHDLVLDQNVDANYYSTLLLDEALDLDHKMLILGIVLYHDAFSHLCVKHNNYPEHDILYLCILFYWVFLCTFPDKWLHVFNAFYKYFLGFFSQTDIIVLCEMMHENMWINFFIPVVEHLTLIDIYNTCRWHWEHWPPLCHVQVHW